MTKKRTTPNIPSVVILSFWRDDMAKRIEERTQHLLSKSYGNLRFVWVTGDNSDDTEGYLRSIAAKDKRVSVIRFDSGMEGEEPNLRLERLSRTADVGLQAIRKGDVYGVIHESDLVTPVDVIEQFIATGKDVVGGSVWLGNLFYDTFVYRIDGVRFTNEAPYHPKYNPNEMFQLDSVGSCWMFPARSGVRCTKWGCLEMCDNLREQGYTIWCNPLIRVIQPIDLWVSRGHANR